MTMQGSGGASVRAERAPKQVTLPQSLPESSARHPDTEEATGSIPVPPTTLAQVTGQLPESGTGLLDHLSVVRPWDLAPGSGRKRRGPAQISIVKGALAQPF
jgi:hypothetical protein